MKNKVLLLGANGFIGRQFIKFLKSNNLESDYSFTGYDIAHTGETGIPVKIADLTIKKNVEKIIISENPDYIINLAAKFTVDSYEELYKINVEISRNIFECLIANNIFPKKILLVGSAAEYGNNPDLPLKESSILNSVNDYGKTKGLQTKVALEYYKNHNLNCVIGRPFNIFSYELPASLSLGSFLAQINSIKDSGVIKAGNLNTKRDFVYVEDAVSALWKILINGDPGEVYNICSGRSILIHDFLDFLIRRSGKQIKIEIDPERYRKVDIYDSYGDNNKLSKNLNWTFTPIEI